jgi:hypothetical protein
MRGITREVVSSFIDRLRGRAQDVATVVRSLSDLLLSCGAICDNRIPICSLCSSLLKAIDKKYNDDVISAGFDFVLSLLEKSPRAVRYFNQSEILERLNVVLQATKSSSVAGRCFQVIASFPQDGRPSMVFSQDLHCRFPVPPRPEPVGLSAAQLRVFGPPWLWEFEINGSN